MTEKVVSLESIFFGVVQTVFDGHDVTTDRGDLLWIGEEFDRVNPDSIPLHLYEVDEEMADRIVGAIDWAFSLYYSPPIHRI